MIGTEWTIVACDEIGKLETVYYWYMWTVKVKKLEARKRIVAAKFELATFICSTGSSYTQVLRTNSTQHELLMQVPPDTHWIVPDGRIFSNPIALACCVSFALWTEIVRSLASLTISSPEKEFKSLPSGGHFCLSPFLVFGCISGPWKVLVWDRPCSQLRFFSQIQAALSQVRTSHSRSKKPLVVEL